ncbi:MULTISPECIES: MBL fold metallo-hydrolase [Brevibacterium]|uniref:MBL fold metallo-hydrolase n=2 Tax=Brevibacterium TaxID=1696 RepID=A0ABP9TVL7_9MICO
MKLTALGTAGSFPGPGSSASCYLVETEEEKPTRVVLDLGSGALTPLQRAIDLDSISAVVLSHLHPDHCMDMLGFYVRHSYDPRFFSGDVTDTGTIRTRTAVYAPAGAQERLTRAYHTDPGKSPTAGGCEDTDFSRAFEFVDLDHRLVWQVGSLTLEAFLVDHPVETYAVRITDAKGSVIVYSGDTDECENLVEAARDADLFLCEAAFQEGRDSSRGVHLTGRRAGRVATNADVRSLVLTHIPVWTDCTIVRGEAAGEYRGPIELAKPEAWWSV